jgi:acyl-coenzyme A thioesterase PaaI-like protein
MNRIASTPVSMVPFRLPAQRLSARLQAFNQRREMVWFGLQGSFDQEADAVVRFQAMDAGIMGGGGVEALNGGVVAAGFDAVCVLAALAQFDVEVIVTLTLNVQFLRLAKASSGLEFRAQVSKSAKQFCFVQAQLSDRNDPEAWPLATAMATLAPR